MIEKIAYSLGRKDEEPNIALALELSTNEDVEGIKEIVDHLKDKNKQVANDCIKVVYEIADRKPTLIAGYVEDFLNLLHSKNNRLVWGAMTSLSKIALIKPHEIMNRLGTVLDAYKNGSVITVDNSISVFAELVKSNVDSDNKVFNIILDHLSTCRPKEVGQHSERASICINEHNSDSFKKVLEKRIDSLTAAQQKRVQKLIKKIEEGQFVSEIKDNITEGEM